VKKNNYVKYSLVAIAALLVVLVAVLALKGTPQQNAVTSQDTSVPFATGKVVNVGVTGSTYTFSPSQVKKGEKVSLVFDMSQVRGCARSIVIQDFGIRKILSEENKIIEFTPQSAGTVRVACSMNMYRGSFEVVE
jgi:plastocyanin domain-containing protein